jgi:Cu(I)-responsive transcriptional regulator
MNTQFSIGEMARAGGCKVQTIRYYEQIGLLPRPQRTQGNQRIYTRLHFDRLRFIRHSRELGFSLDHIRQVLDLSDGAENSCEKIDRIAKDHLREVESKIQRLQSLRKELKRMISECAGNRISDCHIIKVLSDHALCQTSDHLKQ